MRIVCVASKLAIVSSAFLAGCAGPSGEPSLPKVCFAPQSIDIGRILTDSGTEQQIPLRIENRGTAPLKIISMSSSCHCTVVQSPRAIVEAGEFDTITILVQTGIELGPKMSRVQVVTNDPNQPNSEIPIRWTVVAPLVVEPSSIDFGELEPGASATQLVKVGTTSETKTDGVRVEGIVPGAHWEWSGPVRGDGTRELMVTLTASESVGRHAGSIRMMLGDAPHQFLIPVQWSVVAQIECLPPAIFSARVSPAQQLPKVVRLRSRRGEPFRIRGVIFEGATGGAEADVSTNDPANEHELAVRWTVPSKRGIHRIVIRVDTDLEGATSISIPWSVVVS